jgi:hypothetical protein
MKFCFELNCQKRASYNYLTETKPVYCLKHKKDNMIYINSTKCIKTDCPTRANYNYSSEKKHSIAQNIKNQIWLI